MYLVKILAFAVAVIQEKNTVVVLRLSLDMKLPLMVNHIF